MEVFLIRHTAPKIDKGICYGQTDLPLRENFEAELQEVRKLLPNEINQVYSSPLARCVILAKELDSGYIPDERLMELNFGEWEMKRWNEIPKNELDPWMKDYETTAPPKGESMQQLSDRVIQFYKELVSNHSDDRIALITHHGVIRSLYAHINGLSLSESFSSIQVAYGGVIQLV